MGSALALGAAPLSSQEDDFKFGAVTDSKLHIFNGSLGAASPRFDFEYFEAVIADRFYPENIGYFAVLRYKTEIELFLR
jgi:hypothetical protein